MADNDIRKMNRAELVEIIYALQKHEKELQEEIDSLKAQLNDKNINLENAGSIAVAALQVTGIFQNAQEAADVYINSLKTKEQDAQARADEIIQKAEVKAKDMLANVQADIEKTMYEIQNALNSSFDIGKYQQKDDEQ